MSRPVSERPRFPKKMIISFDLSRFQAQGVLSHVHSDRFFKKKCLTSPLEMVHGVLSGRSLTLSPVVFYDVHVFLQNTISNKLFMQNVCFPGISRCPLSAIPKFLSFPRFFHFVNTWSIFRHLRHASCGVVVQSTLN